MRTAADPRPWVFPFLDSSFLPSFTHLPTLPIARRTRGCKWYIHYSPQSNGWNLLGDKLLRPPTLLAEFRDSIRAEAERDTFWGYFSPFFLSSSPRLLSRTSPLSLFSNFPLPWRVLFSFSVDAAYREDHHDSRHLSLTPLTLGL